MLFKRLTFAGVNQISVEVNPCHLTCFYTPEQYLLMVDADQCGIIDDISEIVLTGDTDMQGHLILQF